eukprot:1999806-Pleurochrysis_carterae.AAC.2
MFASCRLPVRNLASELDTVDQEKPDNSPNIFKHIGGGFGGDTPASERAGCSELWCEAACTTRLNGRHAIAGEKASAAAAACGRARVCDSAASKLSQTVCRIGSQSVEDAGGGLR